MNAPLKSHRFSRRALLKGGALTVGFALTGLRNDAAAQGAAAVPRVLDNKEVDAFLSRRFKRQKELCEFEKYSATDCLSRGFPEMAICRVCKQRRQAARWKRIIWIYFRMEWNEKDTTSEIYGDTSEINTYKVIRAIGNIRSARARDLRLAGNSNRVVPGNNC